MVHSESRLSGVDEEKTMSVQECSAEHLRALKPAARAAADREQDAFQRECDRKQKKLDKLVEKAASLLKPEFGRWFSEVLAPKLKDAALEEELYIPYDFKTRRTKLRALAWEELFEEKMDELELKSDIRPNQNVIKIWWYYED